MIGGTVAAVRSLDRDLAQAYLSLGIEEEYLLVDPPHASWWRRPTPTSCWLAGVPWANR